MFRGRYHHSIDPKGRLSVPAKFRDALAQYGDNLVVVPNEHSLEVHPLEEWQRIEEKLGISHRTDYVRFALDAGLFER